MGGAKPRSESEARVVIPLILSLRALFRAMVPTGLLSLGSSNHPLFCILGLRGKNSYGCPRLFHNPLLDSFNLAHNFVKDPCLKLSWHIQLSL